MEGFTHHAEAQQAPEHDTVESTANEKDDGDTLASSRESEADFPFPAETVDAWRRIDSRITPAVVNHLRQEWERLTEKPRNPEGSVLNELAQSISTLLGEDGWPRGDAGNAVQLSPRVLAEAMTAESTRIQSYRREHADQLNRDPALRAQVALHKRQMRETIESYFAASQESKSPSSP
jgi:hypothetical protein